MGLVKPEKTMTQTNQSTHCPESLLEDVEPASTTSNFQFTIIGKLGVSEKGLCLVCRDSTQIAVTQSKAEYPAGDMLWSVIPSSDSTASKSRLALTKLYWIAVLVPKATIPYQHWITSKTLTYCSSPTLLADHIGAAPVFTQAIPWRADDLHSRHQRNRSRHVARLPEGTAIE